MSEKTKKAPAYSALLPKSHRPCVVLLVVVADCGQECELIAAVEHRVGLFEHVP